MPSGSSIKRRQFLSGLMKLLAFIGFVFLSIPFMSSFTTEDINQKQAATSHWVITQALTDLAQGEITALSWSGGLVWVYTRTDRDIDSLRMNKELLRDSSSEQSDQPENMKTNFRSTSENYFVFIPHENKRSCQVRLNDAREAITFTEPCFGAKYDAAGRILENTGHKQQQNLAVPEHLIEDGILKIGIWRPKV